MSDEEEDYMSDAFLAKLQDVTPSLIKDNSVKRRNEIEARQIKEKEKRKPIHEQQKDKLKEGLNKALTSDNKGFGLLAKMGYKEGTSLGKNDYSTTAIKVPIKINIQNEGRLGLGTSTMIKEHREAQLTSLKRKINASDLSTDEYRKQMREMTDKKQVVWDLHKLQRTCRLLDIDNRVKAPIHVWFWPEEKKKDAEESDEEEEKDKSGLSVSLMNF
jgi:hypothetical protein